jgi:hypothetical protein
MQEIRQKIHTLSRLKVADHAAGVAIKELCAILQDICDKMERLNLPLDAYSRVEIKRDPVVYEGPFGKLSI